MNRFIFLAVTIALSGCDAIGTDASAIPFDRSPDMLDGYLLRVPKQGNFLWNGAPVTEGVLDGYIRLWASLPKEAGRLWIEIEPGTSPARAAWVRERVIESGLCRQRRCAEVDWNAKRPVVN